MEEGRQFSREGARHADLAGADPRRAELRRVRSDERQQGAKSKTIFVGVADAGEHHLFRSDDAGETWKPVARRAKKDFSRTGSDHRMTAQTLYVTYGNGVGPNGVTDGAVWKLDVRSNAWTDITPDKRRAALEAGTWGSASTDKSPSAAVATMNRWGPIDTVFVQHDGGATWNDIVEKSSRDVSATPFLPMGPTAGEARVVDGGAGDRPVRLGHACYATGATIYASASSRRSSVDQPTHWKPWVEGIEQTAVLCVMSPTKGAPLDQRVR